jgi:hypothetical protein
MYKFVLQYFLWIIILSVKFEHRKGKKSKGKSWIVRGTKELTLWRKEKQLYQMSFRVLLKQIVFTRSFFKINVIHILLIFRLIMGKNRNERKKFRFFYEAFHESMKKKNSIRNTMMQENNHHLYNTT